MLEHIKSIPLISSIASRTAAWLAPLLGAALFACAPSPGTGDQSVAGSSGSAGSAATGGAAGSAGVAGTGGFGGTAGYGGVGGYGGVSAGVGSTGGSCKAGHYIGQFTGKYRSIAWGNGADTAALDVTSAEDVVAMTVGLEFWLVESGRECDPADEFCGGFTITGGKMRGNAAPNPLVVVPFYIDLTGDLDCNTGEFRGQLSNGYYEVGITMARANFAGDITSGYDHATSSFIDGLWDVTEEAPPPGATPFPPGANIGGEGTWSASWADNNPPPAP